MEGFLRHVLESKKLYLILLLFWLMIEACSFFVDYKILGQIISILLLMVNFLLIYRAYQVRNVALIISFVFIGLYSLVPFYVFYPQLYPSTRGDDCTIVHFFNTTMVFLLFLIAISLFSSFKNNSEALKIQKCVPDNVVWIFSTIIAFLIMLFGKRGENILTGGGYGFAESQNSNLNEYFIVFLLLMFLYSSESKKQKIVFYVLTGLYVIKNLLYGGRVETVEVGFLLVFCITRYKLSLKTHLFFIFIAFLLISIWGTLRGNIEFLTTGNVDWNTVFFDDNKDYIESNEGDVFYASSRMFFLLETSYLDLINRLYALLCFLGLTFVPTSIVPDIGVLSAYKADMYGTGGGGLAPVFFYVYGGYFGVFLLAFLCARVFSFVSNGTISHRNKYFYSALFIAMIPRWFAYYPIHLIKFCLYGLLLFFVINIVKEQMTHGNSSYN